MADHAVGGVDRLVERAARQAAERDPEERRDHAVGEILGQALDRGARDARLVERCRDCGRRSSRRRAARRRGPRVRARRRPRAHGRRGCAAPAGSRRASASSDEADRAPGQQRAASAASAISADRREIAARARATPSARRAAKPAPAGSVSASSQASQRAHPGDGMADRAVERRGIAGQRLDDERREGQRQATGEMDMMAERPSKRHWRRFAYHGGNLGAARRLFPDAPEPWIDLSTGVNPHAYPLPDLPPRGLDAPAGAASARRARGRRRAALRRAAGAGRRRAGLAGAHPVAGAASARRARRRARLQPMAAMRGRLARGRRARRDGRRRSRRLAASTSRSSSIRTIRTGASSPRARLLDSPRGSRRAADADRRRGLRRFRRRRAKPRPACPRSGAVVLRSFGKTYGLAGLRLGFADRLARPRDASARRARPLAGQRPGDRDRRAGARRSAWLEATAARLAADARGSTRCSSGAAGA